MRAEQTSAVLFETTRRVIAILLTLGAFLALGVLFFALWHSRFDPVLTDLVLRQFPVIIGIPFGAIGAFIVVTLLRQREDPLEFEGLGFKLKGAAGEIILWKYFLPCDCGRYQVALERIANT